MQPPADGAAQAPVLATGPAPAAPKPVIVRISAAGEHDLWKADVIVITVMLVQSAVWMQLSLHCTATQFCRIQKDRSSHSWPDEIEEIKDLVCPSP